MPIYGDEANNALRVNIVAGSSSGTEQTEDAASSGGEAGPMVLGVRKDADTSPVDTDGDFQPMIFDANGNLKVNVKASANLNATLQANDGVDIGDVDVASVVPGTGATNLGKAIDNVVGATDTGIALLAKHQEDQVHLATADGDYDVLTLDSLGSLHVNAEAHHVFDTFNATTGWSALNSDTANLATTAKHVSGTAALTFDKVDGAANTVFAAIQKTVGSVDLGAVSPHDLIQGSFYIPDLTNVSYAFLRLGTDSSNYNEWRLPDTNLTAAVFEVGSLAIGSADYSGITGNGWDPSAITYICVGVAFDSETDTLAGIVFDEVSYHTNQHTAAILNAEVSSSVSSPNVRLNGFGGSTDVNTGNASANTMRVVLATDQPVVSVDDNAGSLTVDAANDGSLNVQVGDGTNTATVRNLASNDALNVAIVDGSGNQVTSFGGGTQYAEDTVHSSGDQVTMAGVVQQSADSALSGDGDRSLLQVDASGFLKVNVKAGSSGGVTHTDDAAFTAATDDIVPAGAFFNDSTPDSVDEGDAGVLRMSANRNLYSTIRDAAGNERGVNVTAGNALTVDGSAVTQPVSASSLPLPSGAATAANQLPDGHNVTVDNAAGASAVNIQDGGNSITVDNAGTFAVQATLQASTNTQEVVGDAAHGAAVAGNPLLLAGEARTTTPTAVDNGDAVRLQADDQGRLVTSPLAPRDLVTQQKTTITSSTSETTIVTAQASTFLDLQMLILSNSSATQTEVTIRDSTAGTTRLIVSLAADGGGAVIPFAVPLPQATVNNNWTAQCADSVASIEITAVCVQRV
jgi:hypothetical protein